MAPDHRLVHARHLCHTAITYTEQELGLRTLQPPQGRALLRRLQRLHDQLEELAGALAELSTLQQ